MKNTAKIRLFSILVLSILSLILFTAPNNAMAKREKEAIFAMAGPMYPEAGEGFALNMYISSLVGLTQTNPVLKGKLKISVYDRGMLYKTQNDCLSALSSGAIQFTYSGPHYLEQFAKEWKVGETPGLFESWEHFLRAMDTPVWQELHEKMAKEKNVRIIRWILNAGVWNIFTNKGPAKTLEDLVGQKIRFAGGEGFAKALKALGMTPVALPYTEVITALQTNMVNGIVTSFSAARPYYKLDNYCRFANAIPLSIMPFCIVVNNDWYESLEPDVREAFTAPINRIDTQRFYNKMNEKWIQVWRDDPNTTVIEYDKEEHKNWLNAMRPAVEEVVSDLDQKYIEAIDSTK